MTTYLWLLYTFCINYAGTTHCRKTQINADSPVITRDLTSLSETRDLRNLIVVERLILVIVYKNRFCNAIK